MGGYENVKSCSSDCRSPGHVAEVVIFVFSVIGVYVWQQHDLTLLDGTP